MGKYTCSYVSGIDSETCNEQFVSEEGFQLHQIWHELRELRLGNGAITIQNK